MEGGAEKKNINARNRAEKSEAKARDIPAREQGVIGKGVYIGSVYRPFMMLQKLCSELIA